MRPASDRDAWLAALGLVRWERRCAPVQGVAAPTQEVVPDRPSAAGKAALVDPGQLDWPALRACVADCTRCELHRDRTRTVFGVGNVTADWLIVGEAPGAEEDRRGEPFVGRAGQLLDAMLAAIGQSRETVFITNILKCRPPNNRDPSTAEAAACRPYLERQIELLGPRLILAVGRIAAQQLLETAAPLARLRGQVHRHPRHDVPVVVTYHPAYLLRSPADKAQAWEDLLLACRTAAGVAA
ncbi:MAG: uracil-DNA glycosylase [Gammaproteobacteria bacterium]|nr:uracil-DNA glycosylase [Gammaproteobacteria bacterium]TVQ46714.1 MAG: uracil-DNA glycosylase [Gammaproteobacteria bacterium]